MIERNLAMCYGLLSLFSTVLHNLFLLYHVDMFVSIYKIDKMSFWIGETVFLLWNSCNDPLFGWMSDKRYLISGSSGRDVVLRRLSALQWNGPLFGISFFAFWFAWTYPAVQFIVCLCLYDTFLTMVDLHHSALLADLAVSAEGRNRLNFYCSLFSAFGSLSVFMSYVAWDRDYLVTFQVFCALLALASVTGFLFSVRLLRRCYMNRKKNEDLQDIPPPSPDWKDISCRTKLDAADPAVVEGKGALKLFIRQLSGHKNFGWFAAMNLIQVFHCHFNSNFFPLFLDNLLGDSVPQVVCSLILGVSFMAPHINNLYFLSLCRKYSVYAVIRGLFFFKLVLSLLILFMGPGRIWLLGLFIASNRVFTEGTCKLLNLVISDLVDEDFVIHSRKQAVSALMFGTSALLSKPGQTLAPLIGTWLLAMQTGHDVFQSGNTDGSIRLDMDRLTSEDQHAYRLGVFHLLVYIPIVCALLQLVAWSRFTLKGQRLQWVKSVRAGAQYAQV